MQLVVSRSYPAIDAATLTEYSAREALFRTEDGSFLLYMAPHGGRDRGEHLLVLDCRDALIWLNEPTHAPGSYWHSMQSDEAASKASPNDR
jgi:hypothetical protein